MTKRSKRLLWLMYQSKKKRYRTVRGTPPLTYTAKKAGTLKNYRIYGNTVDGESVGELVETGEHAGQYRVPVTVEGKNLFDYKTVTDGYEISQNQLKYNTLWCISDFIPAKPNKKYIGRYAGEAALGYSSKTSPPVRLSGSLSTAITTNSDTFYIRINCPISNKEKVILNEGSIALPYEPYHAPITTNLYLPEQIKMVEDEAEYVDYQEQKQHRVRKNLFDEQTLITGIYTDNTLTNLSNTSGVYKSCKVFLNEGTYTISFSEPVKVVRYIVYNGAYTQNPTGSSNITSYTFTVSEANEISIGFRNSSNTAWDDSIHIQLELGSTATGYEPYIENTELDVTLPALPTIAGTNTLSVGTEVQPSAVQVRGRIKEVQNGSGNS